MGLKDGFYFMILEPYTERKKIAEEHYADDDDYYTRWCLGAVHLGKIPEQFPASYFIILFGRFTKKYGQIRPFAIDFHSHDSKNPVFRKNLNEDILADLLCRYDTMLPHHREVLDIAIDAMNDVKQVIEEIIDADKQIAELMDAVDYPQQTESVKKEKKQRRTSAQMNKDVRDAIRHYLDNEDEKITQKEVEQMYDLPQGTLSRDRWADVIANFRKHR